MSNVMNLTRMSFSNLKSIFKQTWFVWIIWLGIAIFNPIFLNGLFGLIVFMSLYQVMGHEDMNGIDNLIITLPVKRNEYVVSRYIAGIIILFVSIIIAIIIYFISPIANINKMPLEILLRLGISTAVLTVSIIIPIVLKFGVNKGRLLITIIVMCIITVPSSLLKNINEEPQLMKNLVAFINNVGMTSILVISNIIVLLGSIIISIKLYKTKEIK